MTRYILLADNDDSFVRARAEFLETANYQVLRANTPQQADQMLCDYLVHLAILDLRLVKDSDPRDISGLVLAKNEAYRLIPKIILTSYPSYEHVRQALVLTSNGRPSAVDFLAKQEGLSALLEAVDRAFAQHVRINWDLVIQSNERHPITCLNLVTLIERGLEGERLLQRAAELEDLFRRLFYTWDQIRIDYLLWQRGGRVALTVFAFKAGRATEQWVVVCGPNTLAAAEAQRYREFAPKTPGEMGTTLSEWAETVHFAANAYSLAGADLENISTLAELYRAATEKSFNATLNTLFGETLADWQQGGPIASHVQLDDAYREHFAWTKARFPRTTFEAQVQALASHVPALGSRLEYVEDSVILYMNNQPAVYPSPVSFLYDAPRDSGRAVLVNAPGYLSGDNILTDASGRAWLTDFADAGLTPWLWNFVALEAAIRFDWVATPDLLRLYELETCLIQSEFSKLDLGGLEPELRKPARAIQIIRKAASRTVAKDPLPYHLGILYQAADRLADFDPTVQLTRRDLARAVHALIAAAMLCGNLPRVRSRANNSPLDRARGISIDKNNRTVWVDGQAVDLSPQEFDLVSYLGDRPGQVCRREDIVRDVFGAVYSASESERLNTVMGRLREKIEPDKAHSRYLFTKRGLGYYLLLAPAA